MLASWRWSEGGCLMAFFTQILGHLDSWWQGVWDNYWLLFYIVGGIASIAVLGACLQFGISLVRELVGLFFRFVGWILKKVVLRPIGWLLEKLVFDPVSYCVGIFLYYLVAVPYHKIFGKYPVFIVRLSMKRDEKETNQVL